MEKTSIIKSVSFEYGVIELRSDDILTYKPAKEFKTFSLELVKAAVEILIEVTEENPKLYVCDIRHFNKNADSETKSYIEKTLPQYATACAVLEKSAIIAHATHLFLHFYKPKLPFKLFQSSEKAIDWLKSLN